MSAGAGMLRALRKRRFGMLFSIAAGLMVFLTAAPAQAADLDLPTDAKILRALKAKRLTRCPQTSTRPRCGGARLRNPPLNGRLSVSNITFNDGSATPHADARPRSWTVITAATAPRGALSGNRGSD
jgi:hypothetical protein